MIKHWINGREVESQDTFVNYNPATGEAIGEVASGGAGESPRRSQPPRMPFRNGPILRRKNGHG